MNNIHGFAAWYKAVFDKFFAMIGFNAETPEGIAIIAVTIIVLHQAGQFFAGLAGESREE